jgi:Transcription factor WhiB
VSRNTISHPGLCQQAPARWADPHQQAATRRLCLSCPRLDRCRRETLTENRTFGMWAGVWIDHDLPDKRHLLKPGPRLRSRPPPTPSRRTRVGTLPVNELPPNAAAMVTARASGHCEILAPACLLHQQLIFTRRPQGAAQPPDSPAAALAACNNCAELIEQTDPDTALRYGYTTDHRQPITHWPVYWRQRRWVLLTHFGQLIDHHDHPADTGHLPRPA